ncbi:MAG TPA: ATP-binding cassette domain-containing protein [SAR202 cluster bacterium]|nr:ATP-binding cassette domain-containing protein [SAR202 cluster bacterium]|tara:strand:- start:6091 stop:7089 length:999 start_codon:yes stop_codon:yes gene_type:complete
MSTDKENENPIDPDVTISVEIVSKSFGPHKAVSNLSFSIKRGEIVGFLGPNGAGKTTTMRLLTSYYTPDTGKILINGIDNSENDLETRKSIGYLAENNPLYEDLLVSEYLDFIADLRGLSGKERTRNLEQTVEEASLQEVFYRPISELSKGYHQRVGLAGAIIHRPSILILDEPTEGLDPNQRLSMRDLIKSLGQDRTVLVTTHVMQEVENTCERVLLINRGQLTADSPVDEIFQLTPGLRKIYVEAEGNQIESGLSSLDSVKSVERLDPIDSRKRYIVNLSGSEDPRPAIFKIATNNGWILWELHEERMRLEDVFHTLTSENEAERSLLGS